MNDDKPPQFWTKTVVNGVNCLVPADDATADWLKKRKIGADVALEVEGVRNIKQLKLYWVVCALVAENHEELEDRVAVSDTLKLLSGLVHVWEITLPSGERCFLRKARSVAIAAMKEDEFEAYMNRAFETIETALLPGVDIEAMRKEAYLRAGYV